MIEIYTDGACSGNPGPGGWAFFIKNTGEACSRGYELTTNNRMELEAAINGIAWVSLEDDKDITVYSDSKYLCDAHNLGWISSWVKRGFSKKGGGRVKNVDLWEKLLLTEKGKNVRYVWVKGHDGCKENEICDDLAVKAYMDLMVGR